MKIDQLFFAMVDGTDVFNPAVHNREDLQVLDLQISQSEGEFARAQLEIKNPFHGLLASDRKQFIFISCNFNNVVVPLFAGRILGLPTDLAGQTITIEYIAQTLTWAADQTAFLNTLKVSPYYNILFTDPSKRDDPVEILSTRNSLLHWSRFPGGGVSLSDIMQGSSVVDLSGNFFFDSIKTKIGNPPVKQITGTIEVQWTQNGIGEVDAGTAIGNQFINSGGAPSPLINSCTPLAFEAAWKGAAIPTGYLVKQSSLSPIVVNPSYMKTPSVVVSSDFFPTADGVTSITRSVSVPRVWYNGILKLTATYSQKRREVLSFILNAVTQQFSLLTDTVETVSYKLQDPTAAAQNTTLNPNSPTFFYDPITHLLTVYGQAVVENVLLRSRARLMKAARMVETSFATGIDSLDILNLTCDQSIQIIDDRLPGGQIIGKVLGYSLHISDRDQLCDITIGSIIGTGIDSTGAGTPLATTNYTNEDETTMNSSVIYSLGSVPTPSVPIDVNALQTNPAYCITSAVVTDGGQSQNNNFNATSRPDTYLNAHGTAVTVNLKTLNPSPELLLEFNLTTQQLTLPNQINLEAT